jgi:hypothetical protein
MFTKPSDIMSLPAYASVHAELDLLRRNLFEAREEVSRRENELRSAAFSMAFALAPGVAGGVVADWFVKALSREHLTAAMDEGIDGLIRQYVAQQGEE